MSHVLTLITPRDSAPLGPGDIGAARDALASRGCLTDPPVWLAQAHAADLPFAPPLPREGQAPTAPQAADIAAAFSALPVDIAIQKAENRRKALLIADMDSTMIEVECIDEMADMLGLKGKVAHITERAMRGEIAFDGALRERVALLEGLTEADLQAVYDTRIRFTPGGSALVATMKAHGAFTALVSGGFTFFTSRVGAALGFDWNQGNTLTMDSGGKLTGTVGEPILGQEAKGEALTRLAGERGIPLADTLALGDGANDLAMIGASGLGVAFRAKPAVAAQADVSLTHTDLTGVLYLQGYSDAEIVSG